MLEISKNANPNYLCKVVQLKGLQKHSNADRLQVVSIDFNNVITGLDAKEGDVYVYFPLECSINLDFLVSTGSLRPKAALDGEPEQKGFFERNGRVKAMRLRGEKSMGYIVPVQSVLDWSGIWDINPECWLDQEFDTINGKLLVEKYTVPVKGGANTKQGKKPKLSRLVEEHANTASAYLAVSQNKEAVQFLSQGAENNNSNADLASISYNANRQWVRMSWSGTNNASAVYLNGQNFGLDLYLTDAEVLAAGSESDYYNSSLVANGYNCYVNQMECDI